MTQASEQIAKQYMEGALNKKNWGTVAYNVLVEGLVGDGVTNDTAALQALINTAIAAGRKAINFPHTETGGQYYVTTLTNADQVTFFGDNASFVGGYTGEILQLGEGGVTQAEFDALEADYAKQVRPVFNVDGYGALGAPANDYVAIKAAIDAAVAAGGGDVVFPRPEYLTGTTLSWTGDGITLRGNGETILRDHSSLGANRIISLQGTSGNYIENTNIVDITLRNGTATTGNPVVGKDCIRAEFVDGFRVRRCKFTEVEGNYGLVFKRSRNISVIKNKFYRWTYAGMYVLVECDNIKVLDNEFDTAVSTTSANTYTFASGGETLLEGSYFLKNLWIERNLFKNNPRWEGMDCHGGENIWIKDNVIENCKAGIMCAVTTGYVTNPVLKKVTIEGNVLTQGTGEDGSAGINVGGSFASGVLIMAEDITIRDNKVTGFGGTTSSTLGTMQIYWSNNVLIDNNDVREYAQYGINLYTTVWGAKVRNNKIYNARGGVTAAIIAGICVNRSGGCIGTIVEHNTIGADIDSKRPVYGISSENIYLSCQIRGNQFENVITNNYGNAAQLPVEKTTIPTANLIQKYGDVIFNDTGKPGWYATSPKTGFASLNTAVLVTVNITSGSKIAAIATNSSAAYWALPPGALVSIAGAGVAAAALTAKVMANDGTNLTLDTAASTTVTGANLTYQALTVAV